MILITGASGFIGRHLVARLAQQNERPRCLVRDPGRAAQILPAAKVDLVVGDTTQPDTLRAAMQGVDTVIHMAFITADRKQSPGNRYDRTNVDGTANVVAAAKASGVNRFIVLSGLGTKPDRPGSYMQGRYLAEQKIKESGITWTIIQPSVLFGKGAPFIEGLTDLIRTTPVVPLIGRGTVMFQPIYVEDVVSVIIEVLQQPEHTANKTFTIGGPDYYSFTEIVSMLAHAMHKHRLLLPTPRPFVAIGAASMEAALPRPPLTREALALFSFDNTTAINAVERDFGFKPMSFRRYLAEQGVQLP